MLFLRKYVFLCLLAYGWFLLDIDGRWWGTNGHGDQDLWSLEFCQAQKVIHISI